MNRPSSHLFRFGPAAFVLIAIAGGIAPITRARGDEPPMRFGSEFTFSNLKMLLGDNKIVERYRGERARAFEAYAKYVTEYCQRTGDCEASAARNRGVLGVVNLTFSDGIEIRAEADQNVIEFKVTPLTLPQLTEQRARVEEVIFEGMRRSGLAPTSLYGSGHVTLDKKAAFGGDLRRYRDFFVDYYNHPGLADGVLEKDAFNARPISLLPKKQRQAFQLIIADVDDGRITTIQEFEKAMRARVYRDADRPRSAPTDDLSKGHALYFFANQPDRLEIRAIRAQNSVEEFMSLAELFAARIRYLDGLRAAGTPVKLIPNVGANTALQSLSQFYHYVSDAGLPWKKFTSLLPAKYAIFPGVLPKSLAYTRRVACIYWLKEQRTQLLVKIGSAWKGY